MSQLMIDGYVVTDITLRTWEHAPGIEWPIICYSIFGDGVICSRRCVSAVYFWEKVNQSAAMQRLADLTQAIERGDENGK